MQCHTFGTHLRMAIHFLRGRVPAMMSSSARERWASCKKTHRFKKKNKGLKRVEYWRRVLERRAEDRPAKGSPAQRQPRGGEATPQNTEDCRQQDEHNFAQPRSRARSAGF